MHGESMRHSFNFQTMTVDHSPRIQSGTMTPYSMLCRKETKKPEKKLPNATHTLSISPTKRETKPISTLVFKEEAAESMPLTTRENLQSTVKLIEQRGAEGHTLR